MRIFMRMFFCTLFSGHTVYTSKIFVRCQLFRMIEEKVPHPFQKMITIAQAKKKDSE